jgi:hypothetical protein
MSGISFDNYFLLSPEDIVIQILLYLDSPDLLNISELLPTRILNSKRLWIDKYNFDFYDIDWRLFTEIKGPFFIHYYYDYFHFRRRYMVRKNQLNMLITGKINIMARVTHTDIIDKNGIFIGDSSQIIDLITIGGKRKISDQLYKDLAFEWYG